MSGFRTCATDMLQLNRQKDAEDAARQALAKDPSFALAHYLLANSLVLQGKARVEALAHLSGAAEGIPKAMLMSARLRAGDGDLEGARRELGEYLNVCPAGERPTVQRWLNELQTHNSLR